MNRIVIAFLPAHFDCIWIRFYCLRPFALHFRIENFTLGLTTTKLRTASSKRQIKPSNDSLIIHSANQVLLFFPGFRQIECSRGACVRNVSLSGEQLFLFLLVSTPCYFESLTNIIIFSSSSVLPPLAGILGNNAKRTLCINQHKMLRNSLDYLFLELFTD